MAHLPQGFSYLKDIDHRILQDIVYAGSHNFIGRPLSGYVDPVCIVSDAVGYALKAVQDDALAQGFFLKVFDAYRPLRAVEDIVFWSMDTADAKTKSTHYPNVHKADFFDLGYVAIRSTHTFE